MVISKYRDDCNGLGVYWDGTPEEELEFLNAMLPFKYETLWESARSYQENFISGAAYGMITIGVLKDKPKCLVVQNWIQSVWDLYYVKKSQITIHTEPDLDFSSCGDMPYSVPELKQEVYS